MNNKFVKVAFMVIVLASMLMSTVQCTPAPAATQAPAPTQAAPAAPQPTQAPAAPQPTQAPVPTSVPQPTQVVKPYDGVELTLASMTDQYVVAWHYLLPKFAAQTGIIITVDELGYDDLYQKLTADFVGHTAQYDLMTTDIVWSGQFAANKNTLDLTDLIAQDKANLNLDDIPPVMWTEGEYLGHQNSFPIGGYANVLNYRKDLFAAKGLTPPTTQEELLADAQKLNDPAHGVYGIALLGAGSAGAQDYMAFVQQHGGSVLDANGKPLVNTPDNVKTLQFFGSLFKYAPPGNANFWWDDRETAFREGKVAMMEGWSISRNDYEDPTMSQIVGKVDIVKAPTAAGMAPVYGFGGWGLAINADSDKKKQEAAWEFIKWFASPEVQKDWVLHRGPPLRISTMQDPAIVKALPWMPILLDSFMKGDGNYRPRIPQYSIIEDALGTYVNSFLVGKDTAQSALDKAQAQILKNWQ
ncbi:MAG: sugar ABC transporter substrate-binding protein [Negativicutes bacterium]|nr:sugar ABC transporter substrate-binding protein [Negativicutes bacterium]